MKLVDNWKVIIKRAWSFRLMLVAGLLSGAEVIVPLFEDRFPRGVFAALAFSLTVAANAARVIQQLDLYKHKDDNGEDR